MTPASPRSRIMMSFTVLCSTPFRWSPLEILALSKWQLLLPREMRVHPQYRRRSHLVESWPFVGPRLPTEQRVSENFRSCYDWGRGKDAGREKRKELLGESFHGQTNKIVNVVRDMRNNSHFVPKSSWNPTFPTFVHVVNSTLVKLHTRITPLRTVHERQARKRLHLRSLVVIRRMDEANKDVCDLRNEACDRKSNFLFPTTTQFSLKTKEEEVHQASKTRANKTCFLFSTWKRLATPFQNVGGKRTQPVKTSLHVCLFINT